MGVQTPSRRRRELAKACVVAGERSGAALRYCCEGSALRILFVLRRLNVRLLYLVHRAHACPRLLKGSHIRSSSSFTLLVFSVVGQ
jgi:hypothetical protein